MHMLFSLISLQPKYFMLQNAFQKVSNNLNMLNDSQQLILFHEDSIENEILGDGENKEASPSMKWTQLDSNASFAGWKLNFEQFYSAVKAKEILVEYFSSKYPLSPWWIYFLFTDFIIFNEVFDSIRYFATQWF